MSWWVVLLIVIGFYLALGPVMWVSCKLNKIDPYILEKEHPEEVDERSFILVSVALRPMLTSLWLETKIIRWIKSKFKKEI